MRNGAISPLPALLGGFVGQQETRLVIHRRVTTNAQVFLNITIFFLYTITADYTIHDIPFLFSNPARRRYLTMETDTAGI